MQRINLRARRKRGRLHSVLSRVAFALILTMTGVSVSAIESSGASTAKATHLPVVLQLSQGLGSSYTAYVAYRQGFFYRAGLNVTTIAISGSAAELAALAGGSVNVIGTTPENIFVALAKGLQAETIDSGENSDGFFEFVANDTIPQGGSLTQALQRFRGKTLGVSGLGSSVEYATEQIMASAGLTYPADYSIAVAGSGATYLAALNSNKIQGGLVPEPVPIALVAGHTGWIVDPLNKSANGFPKQLTSGLPYADQWVLDSWASTNKQAIKDWQKAMAQAYVYMHNSKNFAVVEADALDLYGGAGIPTGGLAYLTKVGIEEATAWVSPSALAPFDNFDKQFGFTTSIVPVRSVIDQNPRPPSSETQAIALAKS